MRVRQPGLPAAFGVAAALILVLVWGADRGSSVVVRDGDGSLSSRHPLPDSGEFGLQYAHSYYKESAVEHFAARDSGSFELVGISSPSEAVLDYYELEGHKETTDDGWIKLVPEEARDFRELPLISTTTGGRTLVVSGERTPLFAESGEPAHLTLRVEEDSFRTGVMGGLTQTGWRIILAA